MALTSLNPNLLGTDSSGASKLSSAGGLVQLHSTGLLAIANNSANNFAVTNAGSVGIGTTSPSGKLDIVGSSSRTRWDLSNTTAVQITTNIAANAYAVQRYDADSYQFYTTGSEKARFDTSGNFIIGNTVANTVTGGRQLTIQNNGFATISVQANDTGNDRNATLELLSSGNGGSASQIIFGDTDTTPGTPSPLIFAGYHNGTKTTRMILAANGNLGINNSTPQALLHIQGAGTTSPSNTSNLAAGGSIFLYNAGTGSSTDGTVGVFGHVAGSLGIASGIGFSRENLNDWATQIRFYTHPSSTSNIADVTERMRLTGAGYLGLGTTNPTEVISTVGRRGMYKPTDTSRRCVEFFTNISATTSFVDLFQVDVGSFNEAFYYEIIVTGGDWSNHSAARAIKRGFHCPNSSYSAHSVVESSGTFGSNIIYDYSLSGNVFNGKLRLDEGSVPLRCYVRLVGRLASYTVYGTE